VGFAAGKSNLILIFDASGSMWGQIDGKAKITIAKEAMDLIVNALPADMDIGLVAYGHRRKGDCDDVETLIPLGPLNAKAFLAKIKGLNPKGKTPMVRSIRKTADAIKHLEDETTILLVSDGRETCDPEPCNFVAELKKLGIKFRLHVVGFDVGGETEEQLKCMAKAGGGEYFPAKDAGKLKDALNTVIEKTVVKNLKVSVFLNGAPIGADVTVQDPKTGETVARRFSSEKRPLMLSVKPGTYTVTVTDEWVQEGRPKQVFENIQITDKALREITANFGGGTLTVWNIKNGQPFKGTVTVSTMDGKTVGGGFKTTHPNKPATYDLQPGQYHIVAEDSWGTRAKIDLGTVEISGGQTIEKKASFDSGKIIVWIHKNGKPAHASVIIVDGNGKEGSETTHEDRPATFNKEPGTYRIIAEDSWGSNARKNGGTVTLAGGQVIEKKISIDTGKLTVWTHRGGKPFHASVIVKDMNGKTMGGGWGTTHEDRPATYTLMPGTYRVSAEDSWGDPVVKLKFGVVEIKAGQTLNKICDFDAPPPQDQARQAPQATPETATVAAPKQTDRETTAKDDPTAQNPEDMQAMAARIQAKARAQAAAAQAEAKAQMQKALIRMQAGQQKERY
jgi:Ca-activated chloride channel family protein